MPKKAVFYEINEASNAPNDPVLTRHYIALANAFTFSFLLLAIVLALVAAILESVGYLGAALVPAAIAAISALKKLQFTRPYLRDEQRRYLLKEMSQGKQSQIR